MPDEGNDILDQSSHLNMDWIMALLNIAFAESRPRLDNAILPAANTYSMYIAVIVDARVWPLRVF